MRWSGGFLYIINIIYFRHCQERFRPVAAGSAGSDSAAGSAAGSGSGSGSAGSAAAAGSGSGSAAAAAAVVVVVVVVADGDDAPGDVLPCLGPLVFFLGCFFEENRVYYHVYLIMIGS